MLQETPLGQVDLSTFDPEKPTFWVSPDGRHAAYLTEKGIVIDGQASPDYEYGVKPESFTFSPDSRRTAYTAIMLRERRDEVLVLDGVASETGYSSIGAGPVFSPDSQHVGMIARLNASSFDEVPVIDGREGEPHEDFSWESTFTPDSKRFVYAVRINEQYVMREDSVDGGAPRIERDHGPAVLTGNFFYGPERQIGYVAKAADGKVFVVYNGQEDTHRFEEIQYIRISADGKHIAYVAEPKSFRHVVVANGTRGRVYEDLEVDTLDISPDGQHWGYVVEKRRKYLTVMDGQEQPPYDGVTGPVYSPDSQRWAYLAVSNGKVISVVNGKAGKAYDDRGLPVFSPDSKSAAFWAKAGDRTFVVHNGQKQKDYDDVGTPVFSPDSQRLAYLAKQGERWLMVDAGRPGKLYDDVKGKFYFSPDSRHLAMIVYYQDQEMVVVNGVEGTRYDSVVTLGGVAKIHFDGDGKFHYLATKGNELFLVEESLE